MDKVDQFESLFKSAIKAVYEHEEVSIGSVLVITDLDAVAAQGVTERLKRWLAGLGPEVSWETVDRERYADGQELLELVEREDPGLICTWRNLHSPTRRSRFTLGSYLDMLTQACQAPVLVVPHPGDDAFRVLDGGHRRVMVITDHLTGAAKLVNRALRFVPEGGTLLLAHVEDGTVFARYVAAISRIPSINTDEAHAEIYRQLLKEPGDYAGSVRSVLEEVRPDVTVEEIVAMGRHRLAEYTRLVTDHAVDLLVMDTKDDDQLAMHGLAYPMAVELRHIPVLMI